jgi:hypothetical protein
MRTSIICVLLLVLVSAAGWGQEKIDVIYLKNGDIRKGTIIENVMNDYIKVETSDGSIFTIKYADIQKMTKETQGASVRRETAAQQEMPKPQPASSSELNVGIKGVMNFAWVGGDEAKEFNTATRFGAGIFLEYVMDPIAVQGEVLFNQKGPKWEETGASMPTRSLALSYIDIVALAKYAFPAGQGFRPSVFIGPSAGILVAAILHEEGSGREENKDWKDQFAGSDFGIIGGVGVSIDVGSGDVYFDVRYCLGLSNIDKAGYGNNTNQVLSLNVGYAFL